LIYHTVNILLLFSGPFAVFYKTVDDIFCTVVIENFSVSLLCG